jgi:hypothetical protein
MIWLESIDFRTLSGGANSGKMAYTVEFNGAEPTGNDIAETLLAIRDYEGGPCRNVCLLGTYPSSESVFTFVKTLKDFRFSIQAIITGKVYYSWLSQIDWIVAIIGSDPWPAFKVHEIRYVPGDPLTDPTMPEVVPLNIFLDPTRHEPKEVFEYLKKTGYNWGMLMDQKTLSRPVWRKK